MEQKTFLSPPVKAILIFTIVILTGILLIAVGNPFKKALAPMVSPKINAIEISTDKRSVLAAETKEVLFTIDDAKKYLKNAGYEYNSDAFQTTNAKYEGDCFLSASLSNDKNRIVFSTGCLPGDLPQAWIGVYTNFSTFNCALDASCKTAIDRVRFLIGGSGRNFVWLSDDKVITYEADLGLSGLTETRTINSTTGEVIKLTQ